ncbi:MAG: hypothetical protein JWP80_4320 [Pseudomonas sp.]|nr:hypothetical protein [Pseudomonas sp.]
MSLSRFCRLVFIMGLTGCATTSHEPPPVPSSAVWLNNEEVRDTLLGNTFSGVTRTGLAYSLKFFANGTDVYTQSGQAPVTEKWTLKEGLVCIVMKDYPTECSHVKVTNFEYWFVDSTTGKVNAYLKLVR